MKLTAENLKDLLIFYIECEVNGIQVLRSKDERLEELAPLIEHGFLRKSSEPSAMFNYTTGHTITEEGKVAILAAVEVLQPQAKPEAVQPATCAKGEPDKLYTVRLYDGFDNIWIDVLPNVLYAEARKEWDDRTLNGTEKTRFSNIDYYDIFLADTKMLYSVTP
jgi:hypothetical protein